MKTVFCRKRTYSLRVKLQHCTSNKNSRAAFFSGKFTLLKNKNPQTPKQSGMFHTTVMPSHSAAKIQAPSLKHFQVAHDLKSKTQKPGPESCTRPVSLANSSVQNFKALSPRTNRKKKKDRERERDSTVLQFESCTEGTRFPPRTQASAAPCCNCRVAVVARSMKTLGATSASTGAASRLGEKSRPVGASGATLRCQ